MKKTPSVNYIDVIESRKLFKNLSNKYELLKFASEGSVDQTIMNHYMQNIHKKRKLN